MTTTAPARLASRFSVPILCIRVERLHGAYFRFTAQPFAMPDSAAPPRRRGAQRILEGWIRERPEQWLWLHRRWPPEAAASGRP